MGNLHTKYRNHKDVNKLYRDIVQQKKDGHFLKYYIIKEILLFPKYKSNKRTLTQIEDKLEIVNKGDLDLFRDTAGKLKLTIKRRYHQVIDMTYIDSASFIFKYADFDVTVNKKYIPFNIEIIKFILSLNQYIDVINSTTDYKQVYKSVSSIYHIIKYIKEINHHLQYILEINDVLT
jgi:hypothetical protein